MNYLTKEQLVIGKAYAVDARNFEIAIWDGKKFHGVRYKFGDVFVDGEYHWDDGPPFGTVKPIRELK